MGRKSVKKDRKAKSAKTEKWVNSLLPQLQNRSLKQLTMDDIAALIGRSKSTVYEYFKTKEEVFSYMVDLQLQNLSAYRSILTSESDDLIPCFEEFILFVGVGITHISHNLLNELKEDFPNIWLQIANFINEMLEHLKAFYERGIELKQFKNVSPELMTKMDEVFVFQIISDKNFFVKTKMTLDEVAKDYLRLKLEGMRR